MSRTMNLFNCLLVRIRVRTGAECAKITYPMRVRIARARVGPMQAAISPLTLGSQGSDLNPVIEVIVYAL